MLLLLLSLLSIIFSAAKVVDEGGDCQVLSPLFRGGVLVLLLPPIIAGYWMDYYAVEGRQRSTAVVGPAVASFGCLVVV